MTHQQLGKLAETEHTALACSASGRACVCPGCGRHFTGQALFGPFDGERLVLSAERQPAPDPLVGMLVEGRYRIVGVLGEGSMGRVYRARHEALGRLFALKALKPELARHQTLGERFIQQAKAAARVNHPNVVQITDTGLPPSGQPYFVMELLEGSPLSRLVGTEHPFAPSRAVHIGRELAEALQAVHQAGIVHRDLKPDNIYIGSDDVGRTVVKVLDFGLAKVAGSSSLTRAGMVFGTVHYMSPERTNGGAIDERIDIYALGVVLFEMLTGRVPFEADTYMGVLTKHLYVVPPRPSQVVGQDRFGPLEAVVLRCLAKNLEDRFASMAALSAELDSANRWFCSGHARWLPGVTSAGRVPSRRRPWPWLLGVVGLAGVGAAIVTWGSVLGWVGRPEGRPIGPGLSRTDTYGDLRTGDAVVLGERSVRMSVSVGSRDTPAWTDLEPHGIRPLMGVISPKTTRARHVSVERVRRPRVASQRTSSASSGEIVDPWAPLTEP